VVDIDVLDQGAINFFLEIWRRYPENQTAFAAFCMSEGRRERCSSTNCDVVAV
jgi:hypothetical protein